LPWGLRYIAGMEAYGGDVHGLRDALADAKVTAERADRVRDP
jgi:hypothetical protein